MIRALLAKLARLGRDEDGAALIVTLALFMFMYLSCAGVFAVGQQVKNKIHLQNACDAAAYSAAVVQADTLSRIATINRAMAWTYISMSKRQMDYIVWKWLNTTVEKVKADIGKAKEAGSEGSHYPEPDHKKYWALKPDTPTIYECHKWDDEDHDSVSVSLNGSHEPKVSEIKNKISDFKSNWYSDSSDNARSFYNGPGSSIDVLRSQIDEDKAVINDMFTSEKNLSESLPARVESTVEEILKANFAFNDDLFYMIEQSDSPYDDYMRILASSEESSFLSFADYDDASKSSPFGTGSGSDEWFPLGSGNGFLRKYQQADALESHWAWASWRWVCTSEGCVSERSGGAGNECLGSKCHDSYFDGVAAKPLVLTDDYFGGAGTITVGLASYNENPWYRIFGASDGIDDKGMLGGIYGAFNPYKYVEWTWTFSSAKAGYKNKDEDLPRRDYMIHWDKYNQSWNLCQSDWDAVFVPVRRAASKADGVKWNCDEAAPLKSWVEKGDWKRVDDSGSSSTYAFSSMKDLPRMKGDSGGIDWGRLAKMLYH